MTRNGVAAAVRRRREEHPEAYCPVRNCLWSLRSGPCPKLGHAKAAAKIEASLDKSVADMKQTLGKIGIEVTEVLEVYERLDVKRMRRRIAGAHAEAEA